MSIFTKTDEYTDKPNRNTFDLSFANNLTLKAGQITPCFIKEVLPGDSVHIQPKLGFSFMPMVFPVQTDMQANVHFFYVRNRALWKGWENFITKTENLEGDSTPPYIQLTHANRSMFNTGEIGDYLGVPSVYYTDKSFKYLNLYNNPNGISSGNVNRVYGTSYFKLNDKILTSSQFRTQSYDDILNLIKGYLSVSPNKLLVDTTAMTANSPMVSSILPLNTYAVSIPNNVLASIVGNLYSSSNIVTTPNYSNLPTQAYIFISHKDEVISLASVFFNITKAENAAPYINGYEYKLIKNVVNKNNTFIFDLSQYGNITKEFELSIIVPSIPESPSSTLSAFSNSITIGIDGNYGFQNQDRSLSELPFCSTDNPEGIRISAMPFRAVEACYNSFYRDDRNNPLLIDGKPYYNIWVQNRNGGADTGLYKLYKRNWTPDVFTTAVSSPQQGIMPLVGVTGSGVMTFQDENGTRYTMQATFGDDGETITGISSYSSDMPQGTLRAMVDTISSGISINDFRNVNAFQRWLETNMRKGLRYKDQIEAHFGTSPTYSELQMPEFIGGMSCNVNMSAIEQSVDTLGQPNGNALGTLAGRASVKKDGQTISHYCDEHGWIIGFVTVTPTPVYSQQLNKQLLKTELLDYYFPEFAHIGFQPILNREIAPLQCSVVGTDENSNGTDDVFGYQRSWYEYLESVDEVHGDYRTNMRDYLINRVFNGVPKLSEEFLTVSDKEVNEVFAVQDDSDKIFGQIFFDVKMKRPIPRLGIPKLEVG